MDDELRAIRNRLLIGLLVIVIFSIPIIFILKNKFTISPSEIINKIDKEEDLLILVVTNDCSDCNNVEEVLTENDVNFYILNKTEEIRYRSILNKINISSSDIAPPTLIYLKEGKLVSSLVSSKEDEIVAYLKSYELLM